MTWWFGNLEQAPSGSTWSETGTEDYGMTVYHHWRCRRCKRTAVTAGAKAPTKCCCEAVKP